MLDPFESPFGDIEHNDFSSWDLETDPLGLDDDHNTSPIMTMPGDCGNAQAMQVHVAPANNFGGASNAPDDHVSQVPDPSTTSSDKARRITVWNRTTKRKVSGNAAPMEKNLQEYLRKHPDCELYTGQDRFLTTDEKQALIAEQNRIPIWNKLEQRKISGNAAPSEKNLAEYLRNRPHCEVYAGQDKPPGTWTKPEQTASQAAAQRRNASRMEHMAQEVPHGHNGISMQKTAELPIPKNTSLSDVFHHRNDADMYTGIGSDIPFKPDESEVFSMSGLADSLSLDDNFGGGFMDMCGTSLPDDGGMAVSPAQRILNDRAMRDRAQDRAVPAGGARNRNGSSAAMGIGISQDVMGMSFSYRDLLGMSAGSTPTPGGLQQAYDFLERGVGMSDQGAGIQGPGIASDL